MLPHAGAPRRRLALAVCAGIVAGRPIARSVAVFPRPCATTVPRCPSGRSSRRHDPLFLCDARASACWISSRRVAVRCPFIGRSEIGLALQEEGGVLRVSYSVERGTRLSSALPEPPTSVLHRQATPTRKRQLQQHDMARRAGNRGAGRGW
ncbi:hypothetical protein ERJ75_000295500 [Trypanosoma vivax]|nr:hypothetical protein ERJ75_000295500 [Trypanosoma vivax]